jgi:hypothetical protein
LAQEQETLLARPRQAHLLRTSPVCKP